MFAVRRHREVGLVVGEEEVVTQEVRSGASRADVGRTSGGFSHEALLFSGEEGFLAGTAAFIEQAIAREEPVLVVLGAGRIDSLRKSLGDRAQAVEFGDMAELGRNPARIIPAWREFVARHAGEGRCVWGIGEPAFPGRSAPELAECHSHEALLNMAFADAPGFRLLCPYNVEALEPAVIERVCHTHPVVIEGGLRRKSPLYGAMRAVADALEAPLSEPPGDPEDMAFEAGSLRALRRIVAEHAARAGLAAPRADELVLAVNEVASNSVRHGGGGGVARIWEERQSLVVEIRGGGVLDDPLAGRARRQPGPTGGHGLWLANHLVDLTEMRSFAQGTVFRLHMWLDRSPASA
jgi:anti-sigma regulatory factor (Ser/Thr protein kinase)